MTVVVVFANECFVAVTTTAIPLDLLLRTVLLRSSGINFSLNALSSRSARFASTNTHTRTRTRTRTQRIGMGNSDKLPDSGPGSYTFEQHADFLDKMLRCAGVVDDVTLVVHDWGSALGFWWAYRNPDKVKGIAYMEALVKPLSYAEDFSDEFTRTFQALRTDGVGEEMVLDNNLFVEGILPSLILRNLTREEMEAYREPYLEPGESRRPTLTWPREVPIDGEPANVVAIVEEYSAWMANNTIPKLLILGDPGVLLVEGGPALEFARTWPNQDEVKVKGLHYLQEDSPVEIADAINAWMDKKYVPETDAPTAEPPPTSTSAASYSRDRGRVSIFDADLGLLLTALVGFAFC